MPSGPMCQVLPSQVSEGKSVQLERPTRWFITTSAINPVPLALYVAIISRSSASVPNDDEWLVNQYTGMYPIWLDVLVLRPLLGTHMRLK